MRESGKPRYVDRSNDIVYRPPYLQSHTKLTGWALPSDLSALQSVCDQALNRPTGGALEYRPLFSSVLMVLADIQKVSSLDPRDAQRGWVPEQDICFWILAGAFKNGTLDHLAFYIPYIWVTNAYTMATGREAFGYPKSYGWAQMASSPTDPGPLWADGMVLATYSPQTEVSRERLISMTQAETLRGTPQTFGAGEGDRAVSALLDRLIPAWGAPGVDWHRVRELAAGMALPLVFLKQFRDCVDPTAACYQAIIEANATVTAFQSFQFLPTAWTLTLKQYASARVLDDLALSAGPTKLEIGFWVDYSFSMDLGREVWKAGT
jgi:hypothetical protein